MHSRNGQAFLPGLLPRDFGLRVGAVFVGVLVAISHLPAQSAAQDPTPNSSSIDGPVDVDFNRLRRKAQRGDAAAQLQLGRLYEQGKGITQDDHQAARWLALAGEQGLVDAQYELGILYALEDSAVSNFDLATHWFLQAAKQGHTEAEFNIGIAYHVGYGTRKDPAKAIPWYQRAAEANHDSAAFRLGVIYYDGEGVAKNLRQAAHWFRRAAEQGNDSAQFNLGFLYLNGDGVEKNEQQGERWLRQAADQGNADAKRALRTRKEGRQKRLRALFDTVWHLDHGEPIQIDPLIREGRNDAILAARPKVEAALKENGVAELAFEPRLGFGKVMAGPGTWELQGDRLQVTSSNYLFSAPLTQFANSKGWYKVQESGIGQIRNRMLDAVLLFEKVRDGKGAAPDAMVPYQTRKYPSEREFIKHIEVTRVTEPQVAWGGMKVAGQMSLDCLLRQCDDMLVDQAPTPLQPKPGHAFVLVEADLENTDTLNRQFALHLIASFFDATKQKIEPRTWHVPANTPSAAGWTDTQISIGMGPGRPWQVRWLYEVRTEHISGSRFLLWGQEQRID